MDTTPTTLSRNRSTVDEQHSVARTLVLHLLPGVLTVAFSVAVAPLMWDIGFPPVMAVYLASVFVLIPFELGYLVYRARKNGTSLGNIVLYRELVPGRQFVLLVIALFVGGSLIGGPRESQNKAKTLQKRSIRPPNREQQGARRGFSTG